MPERDAVEIAEHGDQIGPNAQNMTPNSANISNMVIRSVSG